MKIDLHIHSKSSDGKFTVAEIVEEAKVRNINLLAITDHDSIGSQIQAIVQTEKAGIRYVTGVELNVTFSHPEYHEGKAVSLDFLGYQFDPSNSALESKLEIMRKYREERAAKILDNLNAEFKKEKVAMLTNDDLHQIEESVDGVLGRPHIADYLVKKGIVKTRQEAFDKYSEMRCFEVSTLFRRSIETHPGCRRKTSFGAPQRHSWNIADCFDESTFRTDRNCER